MLSLVFFQCTRCLAWCSFNVQDVWLGVLLNVLESCMLLFLSCSNLFGAVLVVVFDTAIDYIAVIIFISGPTIPLA